MAGTEQKRVQISIEDSIVEHLVVTLVFHIWWNTQYVLVFPYAISMNIQTATISLTYRSDIRLGCTERSLEVSRRIEMESGASTG